AVGVLRLAIPAIDINGDDLAGTDLAEEDLLRHRVLDLTLDGTTQWSCTQYRIETAGGQQCLGLVGELDAHILVRQGTGDTADEQLHHLDDLVAGQLVEDHDLVDTVEELGAEVLLQLVVDLVLHAVVLGIGIGFVASAEAQADSLGDVLGAQVRGEDQHGVLEVHHAALAVGETTILEHLQEGVVDLLVGLLDLVEKHHGERLAADLFGELAALLVADVSGRCTEETGGGEAVVELAHVDLDEGIIVTEQELGQRLGQLGLTHTGRTGEDEGTGRTLRVLQACTGTADRAGDSLDGLVLPDDALVQLLLHVEQAGGLRLGQLEYR